MSERMTDEEFERIGDTQVDTSAYKTCRPAAVKMAHALYAEASRARASESALTGIVDALRDELERVKVDLAAERTAQIRAERDAAAKRERLRYAAQHTLDMLETLDLAALLPASVLMLRAALSPVPEDAPSINPVPADSKETP